MRSTFLNLRAAPDDKLGSVGKASPGIGLRVLDNGEIAVTGANLTPGYWRRADEWKLCCPDGWLRTGDVGELDPDGYLYFHSRKDDLINVGGEKISPMLVEDALRGLITTRAYCVYGVPDPDGVLGEVPALCIEGEPEYDVRKVRTYLMSKIPERAMPSIVVYRSTLPRTPNGKVLRRALRS
jgi:long-chain acyl-CoA synthetase